MNRREFTLYLTTLSVWSAWWVNHIFELNVFKLKSEADKLEERCSYDNVVVQGESFDFDRTVILKGRNLTFCDCHFYFSQPNEGCMLICSRPGAKFFNSSFHHGDLRAT